MFFSTTASIGSEHGVSSSGHADRQEGCMFLGQMEAKQKALRQKERGRQVLDGEASEA